MMRHLSLCSLLLSLSLLAVAQRVEKVRAEYLYHAPENISLEEAKRIALERAKLQAIADAFGTVVSQSNFTSASNRNGQSEVDFFSLGGSEVKGEWIETIGEPRYDIFFEQGMLAVKASACGKIREFISISVDIRAKLLRNGTENRFESSEYRSGDNLYLSFQAPIDGFLLVYLIDHTVGMVYCLLPYARSSEISQKIYHDKQYLFFSLKDAPVEMQEIVDEYVVTCNDGIEQNEIVIIFSPTEIVKTNSLLDESLQLKQLPLSDFRQWLTAIRKYNFKIQLINNFITIKK